MGAVATCAHAFVAFATECDACSAASAWSSGSVAARNGASCQSRPSGGDGRRPSSCGPIWSGMGCSFAPARRTGCLWRSAPVSRVRGRAEVLALGVRVVVFTDRVAVDWVGMPRQPPAALDVAVVLAPPQHDTTCEGDEDRLLAELAVDARPPLVAVPAQRVKQLRPVERFGDHRRM